MLHRRAGFKVAVSEAVASAIVGARIHSRDCVLNACAECGHPHEVRSPSPTPFLTYSVRCACGCTASGEQYAGLLVDVVRSNDNNDYEPPTITVHDHYPARLVDDNHPADFYGF